MTVYPDTVTLEQAKEKLVKILGKRRAGDFTLRRVVFRETTITNREYGSERWGVYRNDGLLGYIRQRRSGKLLLLWYSAVIVAVVETPHAEKWSIEI